MSFGNSNRDLVDRWPQTDPLEAFARQLKAARSSAASLIMHSDDAAEIATLTEVFDSLNKHLTTVTLLSKERK